MSREQYRHETGDTDPARLSSRGGFMAYLRELFGRGSVASLKDSVAEAIVEHEEAGGSAAISADERTMLFNILEYGDLRVGDVMVPRADIVAVALDTGLQGLLNLMADAAHSRLPVYRTGLDDVLGMVHVKDVLAFLAKGAAPGDFRIEHLQRPVLFVPPSMKVMDLLARMRTSRTHMAVVVDEYGGTDGLLTIEDLVEEIVGEIEDEHDAADSDPHFEALGNGTYDADARVGIEDLESVLDVDLLPEDREEDADTLGGLVFTLAGRVPEIGEVIAHDNGYRFEVVDADPRRIHKLRIHEPETDLPIRGAVEGRRARADANGEDMA